MSLDRSRKYLSLDRRTLSTVSAGSCSRQNRVSTKNHHHRRYTPRKLRELTASDRTTIKHGACITFLSRYRVRIDSLPSPNKIILCNSTVLQCSKYRENACCNQSYKLICYHKERSSASSPQAGDGTNTCTHSFAEKIPRRIPPPYTTVMVLSVSASLPLSGGAVARMFLRAAHTHITF